VLFRSIGFDDDFIYSEINVSLDDRKIPMKPLLRDEALLVFNAWKEKDDQTLY
jgi:hypothetical protein